MRVIYYKETEQRIKAKIAAYNATCPTKTVAVKRKHGRGNVEYAYDLKTGALNGNHERTAMALLKVLQAVQYQSSAVALDTYAQIIDVTMPAVATMTGYHPGTVHRHVKRLLAAGVLTNKINRKARTVAPGVYRYQPVQLIFDKSVIAYGNKLTVRETHEAWETSVFEAAIEAAECEAVTVPVQTDSSHMHSKKIQKALVKTVDNAATQCTNPSLSVVGQRSKKTTMQTTVAGSENSKKISGAAAALHSLRLQLVAVLWQFTRARLYAHWTYMSPRETQAAKAFFTTLLELNETEKSTWTAFNDALWTVELRGRWADTHVDQLHLMQRPGRFFDFLNPTGYNQSAKWFAKNKNEKKHDGVPVQSLEAAQTFVERRLFNSYLKNPSLKRRLLVEQRLAQLRDGDAALQRFNALYAFKTLEPIS